MFRATGVRRGRGKTPGPAKDSLSALFIRIIWPYDNLWPRNLSTARPSRFATASATVLLPLFFVRFSFFYLGRGQPFSGESFARLHACKPARRMFVHDVLLELPLGDISAVQSRTKATLRYQFAFTRRVDCRFFALTLCSLHELGLLS